MLNKSYSYLIPLLNEFCTIDGDFYIMLNNVYTRHSESDIDNIIIISYANAQYDEFNAYIDHLKKHELCQDFIEDDNEVVLIFKFPDKYLHEYVCYRNGRFSEFSDEAKNLIIKYVLDINKYSDADRIKKVLYKDESLRLHLGNILGLTIDKNSELSSIPDMNLETFYKNKDESRSN